MKGQAKKLKRLARQQELLSNFEGDFYQEKKIGDEWYIKSFNGGTGRWQVGIYNDIAYRRYKSYKQDSKDLIELFDRKLKPTIPFEKPTLESIKIFLNEKNSNR